MFALQLTAVALLLAGWALALSRREPALPAVTGPQVKLTHVLPTALQVAIFAYWAIYWPGVVHHLPLLFVQLAVAYALEVLLAWTLRRPYTPGFGPVPIVLSTNLFVWFHPEQLWLSLLVIALALASKALLRARGRHVFNPSVFGIAVVAVLCILLPGVFRYEDISHDFDRPPHMAHVIALLALIPQLRLQTTPVALGAAVAMLGVMLAVFALTGYPGGPSPWWPPWLLAITLLAGDPATIPQRLPARLLFGLFLGVAFYVVSRALLFSIGTDFFSKILPIPLANLLVPRFERLGERLGQRWPRLHGNAAYVVAWVLLCTLMAAASGRVRM